MINKQTNKASEKKTSFFFFLLRVSFAVPRIKFQMADSHKKDDDEEEEEDKEEISIFNLALLANAAKLRQ